MKLYQPLTTGVEVLCNRGHCFLWTVVIPKIKEPLQRNVSATSSVKRPFLMGVVIRLVVPVASYPLQQLFIPLQFLTVRVSALLNFSPLLHFEVFNWAGLGSWEQEWTALPFKMLSKRIIGFSNGVLTHTLNKMVPIVESQFNDEQSEDGL